MNLKDKEIIKAWEKILNNSDEPIGEHWMVFVTTQLAKETLNMLNRQKETIQNQDEMKRALINAQETLQKTIVEQKEEIERLEAEKRKLKNEMSYMSSPNTIGDRHEMGC